MKKAIMIVFVIILFLLIVLMPVLLEFFVFRNNFESVLNNETWANFLGGYIGGVLGGVSTLIAVYISTKETRRIQSENYKQFVEENKYRERQEKKKFADEIVEYISKYITYISDYFYSCRNLNIVTNRRDNLKMQLFTLEQRKFIFINENINNKISVLKYMIDECNKDIMNNVPNRIMANECYFSLCMKLKNIEEATYIIKQLEFLHNQNYDDILLPINFISTETDKLQELTICFVTNYIK